MAPLASTSRMISEKPFRSERTSGDTMSAPGAEGCDVSSSRQGLRGAHVFAALCALGFRSRPEIHDDAALGVAFRNCLLQLDFAVAEVLSGNVTEHIRRHHAHRLAADDLLGKGAGAISKDDLFVIFLDDEEVAADAALQIDQYIRDLTARQRRDLKSTPIVAIDLLAHCGADHAYVPGRLLEP